MGEVLGYFVVGDRPVKLVALEGEKVGAEAYDWDTGGFISAPEYIGHILFNTGDTEAVSQEDFLIQVENLRKSIDSRAQK